MPSHQTRTKNQVGLIHQAIAHPNLFHTVHDKSQFWLHWTLDDFLFELTVKLKNVKNKKRPNFSTLFSEMSKNYFALLGIDAGATATEIKKAYHEKARYWHPDKNKGN